MNSSQRIVLSLGSWLLALITLVPPWQREEIVGRADSPNTHKTNAGYRLIFSPPEDQQNHWVSYRIDWSRRITEYLAVAMLTGAICLRFGNGSRRPSSPAFAASPVRANSEPSPTASTEPSKSSIRFRWVPFGAEQLAAMFVEVPPGPPPALEQYLSMLGEKWNGILREESAAARARFIARTKSRFLSLPDPDRHSSFFLDGRTVLARDEWGSILVQNPEVRETLSGKALLVGMNQPVTAELNEQLADHGMSDLDSILTVLENAESSLD